MARRFTAASNEKIDVPTITTSGADWTFSIWANCPRTQAYDTLINLGNGFAKFYIKSNGTTACYSGGSPIWDGTGSQTISSNTWVNITLTNVGSGSLTGYVNAVSDASGTATIALNDICIYGFDGVNWSNSKMADGALWNGILTASEIAALAAGIRPYRIRRSSLISYWPLEGTASPEPDVINGNNGTLTGTSFVANPYNYTTPKYGSRTFNGSSDKIVIGAGFSLPAAANTYSISCWINPSGTQQGSIIGGTGSGGGLEFAIEGASPHRLFLIRDNQALEFASTFTVANSVYTHVGCKWDGGSGPTFTFYKSGVAEAHSGAGSAITAHNAQIGTSFSGEFYTGSVADLAIWNVQLSDAEFALLAAGYRPHQVRLSGLVAYWPLEGTASPEPDMVAGNNGTLTGTSAGASPTGYKDLVGA